MIHFDLFFFQVLCILAQSAGNSLTDFITTQETVLYLHVSVPIHINKHALTQTHISLYYQQLHSKDYW